MVEHRRRRFDLIFILHEASLELRLARTAVLTAVKTREAMKSAVPSLITCLEQRALVAGLVGLILTSHFDGKSGADVPAAHDE